MSVPAGEVALPPTPADPSLHRVDATHNEHILHHSIQTASAAASSVGVSGASICPAASSTVVPSPSSPSSPSPSPFPQIICKLHLSGRVHRVRVIMNSTLEQLKQQVDHIVRQASVAPYRILYCPAESPTGGMTSELTSDAQVAAVFAICILWKVSKVINRRRCIHRGSCRYSRTIDSIFHPLFTRIIFRFIFICRVTRWRCHLPLIPATSTVDQFRCPLLILLLTPLPSSLFGLCIFCVCFI